jgi:hypothetical protein
MEQFANHTTPVSRVHDSQIKERELVDGKRREIYEI